MDDLELLKAYADHRDQEAFAQLVRRHGTWLYAAARRQLADGHLAEDAIQAVFLLLSHRAKGLRHYKYLSGWLFLALSYCIRDMKQQRSRRQQREQEAAAMRPETIEAEAKWDEIAPVLEEAMGSLGRQDREAVLLRFYEQKPLAEVGRLMGISEAAAQKRVERAVGKLREALAAKGVETEAASLAGMVLAHAGMSVPAGFVERIVAGVGNGMGSGTAGGIAQGAGKMMAISRMKVAAAVVAGMAIAVGLAAGVATGRGEPPAQAGTQAPSRGIELPEEKLLHYLVAENQRTRNQLQSVRYSYETTITAPLSEVEARRQQTSVEFPVHQSEKRQVVRKGDLIYSSSDQVRTLQDGSEESIGLRGLTSRDFTAFWMTGTPNAYLHDHKSPNDLPAAAKTRVPVFQGRDILLYGFGTGNIALAELVAAGIGNSRWSAIARKANGQQQYVITQEKGGKRVGEYVLDRDQGFAVVETTVFDPDSQKIIRHCAIEMARDVANAWYPKHITEDWAGQRTEVTVDELHVDNGIDEREFELAALQLPAGTYVHRHALNGGVALMTATGDGKLIDADTYLKTKMAADPLPVPAGELPRPTWPAGGDLRVVQVSVAVDAKVVEKLRAAGQRIVNEDGAYEAVRIDPEQVLYYLRMARKANLAYLPDDMWYRWNSPVLVDEMSMRTTFNSDSSMEMWRGERMRLGIAQRSMAPSTLVQECRIFEGELRLDVRNLETRFSGVTQSRDLKLRTKVAAGDGVVLVARIGQTRAGEIWHVLMYQVISAAPAEVANYQTMRDVVGWIEHGTAAEQKLIQQAVPWQEKAKGTKPDKRWAKDLPGGTHVELAGVSNPELNPYCWWTGDGQPAAPGYRRAEMPLSGQERREVLAVALVKVSDPNGWSARKLEESWCCVKQGRAVEVVAGSGAFKTEATLKPEVGQRVMVQGQPFGVQNVSGSGKFCSLQMEYTSFKDLDVRVVAVDGNGKEQESSRMDGFGGDQTVTVNLHIGFPVSLEQIKELRVQVRPLYRVKFEKLALEPLEELPAVDEARARQER